jgi:hypothetical protein
MHRSVTNASEGAYGMPNNDRTEGDYSLTEPESAPPGRGTPARVNKDAETVGKSGGGFLGGASGMALGAMGGPVGLVVGGLAGALGGWWAGRGIAHAITNDDDIAYRRDFDTAKNRPADRSYADVRPAYIAGHLAGRNPEYEGRSFEDVESDLRCGWSTDIVKHCGAWPNVRGYAHTAFDRARGLPPVDVDAD